MEGTHCSQDETFEEVLQRRLSRRVFLKGALVGAPLLVVGPSLLKLGRRAEAASRSTLTFQPIQLSTQDRIIVPPGYAVQVLIRWGDPLYQDVPAFDLLSQTPELQAHQFGYNCDFVGYFPLPQYHSQNPNWGLLAVNHEYTSPELMFPGYLFGSPTQEQIAVELAAHGVTIVEVERQAGEEWRYGVGSHFNRRITGETWMEITGPAAGHDWMKVS